MGKNAQRGSSACGFWLLEDKKAAPSIQFITSHFFQIGEAVA